MKILNRVKQKFENFATKTRYFSIINIIFSGMLTFFCLSLLFADTYGGGIGLAAGLVVLASVMLFSLANLAYINNYILPQQFEVIKKINALIIINNLSFIIIFIIFYTGFFHEVVDYIGYGTDINIILISHIIIFIILVIFNFKFKNLLNIKIIKYIVKTLNILAFLFTFFYGVLTFIILIIGIIIPLI